MKLILSISLVFMLNARIDTCCYSIELSINPEIMLKEEYTDNLNFSADDIKEDFITSVHPKIIAICENEKNRLGFSTLAYFKKYINEDYLDTFDDLYDFTSSISYAYIPSETFNNSLIVTYDKNSDPQKELEKTGDDPSILQNSVSDERSEYERIEKTIQYKANWIVTDYNLLRVNLFFDQVEYSSDEYLDLDVCGGGIEYGRMISDRFALYAVTGGAFGEGNFETWLENGGVNFKGLSGMDFQTMVGFFYDISTTWSMDFRSGMRRLHINYEPNLQDENVMVDGEPAEQIKIVKSETVITPIGYVEFKRTGEKSDFIIKFDADLVISGRSLFVDKKIAKVNYFYHFSEYFSTELNGKVVHSKGLHDYTLTDTEQYFVSVACKYILCENVNVSLTLSHSELFNNLNDTEAQKNTIFVNFTVDWKKYIN